jgi:hypothetical protein
MRVKKGLFAPLFGAAATALAISAAPIASAATAPAVAPHQDCTPSGAGTICQSPGNAQLNDSPPPVQFYPYGGEAFLL